MIHNIKTLPEESSTDDFSIAIESVTRNARTLVETAKNLCSCGLFEFAITLLTEALELDWEMPDAHLMMAKALYWKRSYHEVRTSIREALEADSGVSTITEAAGLMLSIGELSEAELLCRKVLEDSPENTEAFINLGTALFCQGRVDEAIFVFQTALYKTPQLPQLHSKLIFAMQYSDRCSLQDIMEQSSRWNKSFGGTLRTIARGYRLPMLCGRKLKVGFVSPDLCRHPVGNFVSALFSGHDCCEISYTVYSDLPGEDEVTRYIKSRADEWRWIFGMTDIIVARMIVEDEIDILIDLSGHTARNRMTLFAMKPAAIQLTWAGYVGLTGLEAMDYLLSDNFQSPIGDESIGGEAILRMPNDYVCYMPPADAPDVVSLPALANGYITFGCFNNLPKITQTILGVWREILDRIPDARLFIKNPSLSDSGVVSRFLNCCKKNGIAKNRIIIEGYSHSQEMLEKYGSIDIQLDTFPYSGGLTTLESLWMGVPVVTMYGDRFASRHSTTHLVNAGFEEFVASNAEGYISTACALASDTDSLSLLRNSFRGKLASSPVCDAKRFSSGFKQALLGLVATDSNLVDQVSCDQADTTRDKRYINFEFCGKKKLFLCNASDFSWHVCNDILRGDTYPLVGLKEEVKIIVDIGANVGAATVFFKSNYPKSSIYAFEPASSPFQLLEYNTAEFQNVFVYNCGLSDTNCNAKLYLGSVESVTNSIYECSTNTEFYENIELREASYFILSIGLDHIDILKIDTEGCEIAILKSLKKIIEHVKIIYLEYHSEDDRLTIDSILCNTHQIYYSNVSMVNRGDLVYVNKRCDIFRITPLIRNCQGTKT